MKRILIPSLLLVFLASCSSNQNQTSITTIDQKSSQPIASSPQPASISQPSTISSPATDNTAKQTIKPTFIPNIVTVEKITSDENYNHLLQITVTNLYDKPICNIQVYISDNGNLSIPDGISENDSYLRNMQIEPLQPKAQGNYTISTNDKGAEGREYVVSARRIRFTDGTTVNH